MESAQNSHTWSMEDIAPINVKRGSFKTQRDRIPIYPEIMAAIRHRFVFKQNSLEYNEKRNIDLLKVQTFFSWYNVISSQMRNPELSNNQATSLLWWGKYSLQY